MTRAAILVIHAGSSGVKFALFQEHPNELELELRGHIDGIHALSRFEVKDAAGFVVAQRQ